MSVPKVSEQPGTGLTKNHNKAFIDLLDTWADAINGLSGAVKLQGGVKAITADAGLIAASNGDGLSGLLAFSDDLGSTLAIGDFADGDFILSSNGASSKLFHVYDLDGTLYVEDSDGEYVPDGMEALASGHCFLVENDLLDTTADQETFALYAFNGSALIKLADVDFATQVDGILASLGSAVDSDGAYVARATTNYIDGNSDIDEDLTDLDTQVKTNTDGVSDLVDGTTTRTGATVNSDNAGSAAADVTATEYGDGTNHVTELAISGMTFAVAGAANEAIGNLLYSFPSGVHFHEVSYMNVALQGGGTVNSDTPEVGIGSAEATGANATLGAAGATTEDYIEGVAASNCNGADTTAGPVGATAGILTDISLNQSGDDKTVYLNIADDWAGADTVTASGTVVLKWSTIA